MDRSASSTARAGDLVPNVGHADWIETKGQQLSRIYITHGHGDHWLGLARLIKRFPAAKGLAGMVERYPDWENRRTLWHSARSAIARK